MGRSATPSPRPIDSRADTVARPRQLPALAGAVLLAVLWLGHLPGARADEGALLSEEAVLALIGNEAGADRRVEVRVGRLDPRVQLAPCERVEPFLPRGARLWGRSAIGVRCVQGAGWSVLLPVTVSVYGKAMVANAMLAAGRVPTEADFRIEEVDLTRQYGTLIDDPAQLEGKVLARTVAPGQPLRQDALKVPPVFSAGDPVRIVVTGTGFTITGDGVAMGGAAEGQTLRVRTENGRIVVGHVRDRVVEIRM